MSRRSSPRSLPRRRAPHLPVYERRKRAARKAEGRDDAGERPLRLASGLRARPDGAPRTMPHRRVVTRASSPRHRNLAPAQRMTLPSDVIGVAASFGVSLGAVLISVILGLVGPSWLVAAFMLVCGAALAVFVAARNDALATGGSSGGFAPNATGSAGGTLQS